MNNIQNIISCITGYEHDESYTSARDETYYSFDADQVSEKIDQVMDYAEGFDGVESITRPEAALIVQVIDAMDRATQSERWYIFQGLGL